MAIAIVKKDFDNLNNRLSITNTLLELDKFVLKIFN